MAADLAGWLAPNALYPGAAEALRRALARADARVVVVTTKQARFTHRLLSELAGVELPLSSIFSQAESGLPKALVLRQLAAEAAPGARLVFVEDKLATLRDVEARPDCAAWELLLADWGYNTLAERASAGGRVRLLDLAGFAALLEQG